MTVSGLCQGDGELPVVDIRLLGTCTARVVRRAELEAVVQTSEMLSHARRTASVHERELTALRQQAEAEARAAGFRAGFAAGRDEHARQLLEGHLRMGDQVRALNEDLVHFAMSGLRHLVGALPAEQRFELLARRVLDDALQARRVRLVVSASDAEAARRTLAQWSAAADGPSMRLDVVVDAGLQAGDCVLETELGAVDGRLEERMRAIESVLRRELAEVAR